MEIVLVETPVGTPFLLGQIKILQGQFEILIDCRTNYNQNQIKTNKNLNEYLLISVNNNNLFDLNITHYTMLLYQFTEYLFSYHGNNR